MNIDPGQQSQPKRPNGDDADLIDAARREAETAEPALPSDTAAAAPAPLPDSFAGYQILREIHRGGQGVVYQALQKSTKRKVALKVMKEGPFATAGEQARFEREVQILGQLNHPNIVAIHDSGQAAGCHYFVMDYISGQPLDVWMAGAAHSIEETLRLFAKICSAVNAAHLRGITHRDLKPGNIRVDENGEPHILDFGLAKVAHSPGEASLMTMTGQFMGSLPWASPEQAEGIPSKVDIRTDVYSLGVILYQMLTGRFPYEVIGNMRDVLDRIMRAEPVRPSTIRKRINDEVETIVLKCLAKERERRYQSAGELARDIGHYLAGEPIEAKRDSAAYVLRKYLRKYRLPAAVAAGFVVVVTVGLIGSLTFWRQAVVERGHAEQRRAAAEASQAKAVAEAQRADREAVEAKKQAGIAESANKLMNDMLAKANRGEQQGNPNVTVREVMDIAARELEAGTTRYEPEVEAAVRTTIGLTYRALGLFDLAEPHLRTALELRRALLGAKHPEVAASLDALATLLQAKGEYAPAEVLFRDALKMRREVLGDKHVDVAASLNNLALLLEERGEYAEAEPLAQEGLTMQRELLGDEHPTTLASLTTLALLLNAKGDYTQAVTLARQALIAIRKLRGDEHPEVFLALNNLAFVLTSKGEYAEAEPLFREALTLARKLHGDEHPDVALALHNLGCLLRQKRDHAEAESLLREALAMRRKLLGDHAYTATTLDNLASLLQAEGKYDAAEPLFREVLAMTCRVLGDTSWQAAQCRNNLALLLRDKGDLAQAEPLFREALAQLRHALGGEHLAVLPTMNNLALLLRDKGDLAQAEPLFREALALNRKLLGDVHPGLGAPLNNLALTLAGLGRYDDALQLYNEALGVLRPSVGDKHPNVAFVLQNAGDALRAKGDDLAAESAYREALTIRQEKFPLDHPLTAVSRTSLGLTLARLGRFAEAEPLLLSAQEFYVPMHASPRPHVGPRSVRQVLQGLAELYDAWHAAEPDLGHDQQAAAWRAKLVEWQASTQPATSPSPPAVPASAPADSR
jgi:tetratricopeptide (TPR) repeat protein/predicted Ser/Thr protein kinase